MEIALSLQTLPERYQGVPQRSPAEPAESTLVQSTDMPSQWASLSPAIYGTDHFYLKMLLDSPKTQKRESGLPAPSKSFEPFAVMKNERRFLHGYERRPARWPPGPACCTQTELGGAPWGVRFGNALCPERTVTAVTPPPGRRTPGCTPEPPGWPPTRHLPKLLLQRC